MKTISKQTVAVLCAIATIGLASTGGAWGTKAKSTSTTETQQHTYGRSAIISFDAGSSALSENDRKLVRDLIQKVGSENISRIEVAAWSDKAFPLTGSDLPKDDRDLAEQRAAHTQDFITEDMNISTLKVSKYNMAETSNWLARTFRTDEAELKSVFAKQAVAPMARADFNVIYKEGAPSKAVVIVVRK